MAEKALRDADPLRSAYEQLTVRQKRFVDSLSREKVAEGGNRSGKTWTACVDFLLDALGIHPTRTWPPPGPVPVGGWGSWRGWFATTSYKKFSESAWPHFKRLLLYANEKLPTSGRSRRILNIAWETKYPEVPSYIRVARDDGYVGEIWLKSYSQNTDEFAGASVDKLLFDEEGPEKIYEEAQPRVVERGGQICVAATPVLGKKWLARLRRNAMTGASDVSHERFPMKENPALPKDEVLKLEQSLAHAPQLLKLRMEGFPVSMEGCVYNDEIFTPAHVVRDEFRIPPGWTRFRWIDPGWRNTGCLWFAVSPKQEDIVCYRDYLGHNKTIGENADQIRRMSGNEQYSKTWIDRYYCEKHEEVHGLKIFDLWRRAGVACQKSVEIGVIPAIELVWALLKQRAGPNGERPRFRVMSWCSHFLEEREAYHWPEVSERELVSEKLENPVAQDNHLMDCWKGFVACRPQWVAPAAPMPPKGTDGYTLWKDRRDALEENGGVD